MKLYLPENGGRRLAAAVRWGAAGLLVAGLHVGAGWWLVTHAFPPPVPRDEAEGIPIDLEPVAVPQNAPEPTSVAPAGPAPVLQAATAPEATPTPEPSPPDPTPPDPAPPEPVPPPPEPPPVPEATPPLPEPVPSDPVPPQAPALEQPEPPVVPPPPAQDARSDAVMAAPPPPPPRPKPPPRPNPRVLAREAARRKALVEKREQDRSARRQAQAARAQARGAQAREGGGALAPSTAPSSASSGADVANWRGAVVAHLNGFKPAANGGTGTSRVAFAVDRGGRVVSASLAGSSGDPQLDAAAVAMVRRASPVPAPPADLGGRVDLTVPVRFH